MAIIAVTAMVFYKQKPVPANSPSEQQELNQPLEKKPTTTSEASELDPSASNYQDGTYQATGKYISPGGEREIAVSITLEDGLITASTFEGFASDPASKRFQGEFAEGFQPLVVGKNIDELNLQKVSGSSLTPKGFMDALESIKTQAQS
jgi:uncharacterized protein with FMN-binding domain